MKIDVNYPNQGFNLYDYGVTRNKLYDFFWVTNQLNLGDNDYDDVIAIAEKIHGWEKVQ